jgi:predicted DNA-binding transcriptional regulator AlpA
MSKSTSSLEAFSVESFCQTFGISRSLFYKLRQDGRGPAILKIGRRTLISRGAAERWIEVMQSSTEVSSCVP